MEEISLNAFIEFLDDESKIKENEAEASVSLNPSLSWAKIVVTDSKPNANKHRIPEEEFENLMRTGIYTPIKMFPGSISEGHENTIPLGVISHLKRVGDKLIALAALWKRERPEDISLLKEMYEKGDPPNVSWEIAYGSSDIDDDGIENLRETVLNALVVVGRPAYTGRTAFTAIASKNEDNNTSEDDNIKMDELEKLQKQNEELSNELGLLKNELQAEKESKVTIEKELEELREYKSSIEEEKEKEAHLNSIKQKFSEAGLSMEDKYFEDNGEKFLAMDEESLNFIIQEFVAFSSKKEDNQLEASKKAPNVTGNKVNLSTKEIVDSLKSLKK